LKINKIPSFIWISDLETEEFETYTGKNDKYSMSVWMSARGSRKIKAVAKRIDELNSMNINDRCGRKEKNLCVVAFYKNYQEKEKVTAALSKLLSKYREEPLIFFTASNLAVMKSCLFGSSSSNFFILRTKRRAYDELGSDLSTDELAGKIDSKLGGGMFPKKMKADINACLIA